MPSPVSSLVDYLRFRKECGDRTVELEPETVEALRQMGAPRRPEADDSTSLTRRHGGAEPHPPFSSPSISPSNTPGLRVEKQKVAATRPDFIFVGEQEGIAANRAAYSETLRKMVLAMGYGKGEAVFTNICRGRKEQTPPTAAEMAAALPAFREFVEATKPRGIVVLGSVATSGLLGKPDVSSCHGRVFKFSGIPAIPTYHPAYMEKFKGVKRDACRDLCNALKAVGLPVTEALSRFQ